jgi:putative transposase
MRRFGASLRQACAALRITRSVYGYRSRARDAKPLVLRIKEITATRVHYGYRRVHVLLRREGWKDNHKRVYRLYRNEGLSLRHKRPRRNKAARLRQPKQLVTAVNQIWSMDFVADALFDGRRLRALTVVDNYTRECLAIDVGQRLTGEDVVQSLNRISARRGLPQTIKVDNVLNASGHSLSGNRHPRRCADAPRGPETCKQHQPVVFRGRTREPCLTIVDTRFSA